MLLYLGSLTASARCRQCSQPKDMITTNQHSGALQAVLWSVVGMLLYLGILTASALHVYNISEANRLVYTPGSYLAVHRLGYFISVERSIWAVLSFAIWFRLLKCASVRDALLSRCRCRCVPPPQVRA